jgi:hypothetical protein
MGSSILFHSDNDPGSVMYGISIAKQITDYLTNTAHIRLLGCSTAQELNPLHCEGRLLLLKLARELGAYRTVFGTLAAVGVTDFGPRGLKQNVETERLFSSHAALDWHSPSYHARLVNIEAYLHINEDRQ